MKAAGVFMVMLSGLMLVLQLVAVGMGADPGPLLIVWTLVLVGGLVVWSLQQIREALIGGHPRDVKAGIDEHGYKKPKWIRK